MVSPGDIRILGKQWSDWLTWAKLVQSVSNITESRGIWSISTVRTIGLSNFNILKTKRILEVARIIPAVNQVEIHPYDTRLDKPRVIWSLTACSYRYLPQQELFEFSSQHNILLMAHQPLGGRPVQLVRGHPEQPFPTDDPKACLSTRYSKGIGKDHSNIAHRSRTLHPGVA